NVNNEVPESFNTLVTYLRIPEEGQKLEGTLNHHFDSKLCNHRDLLHLHVHTFSSLLPIHTHYTSFNTPCTTVEGGGKAVLDEAEHGTENERYRTWRTNNTLERVQFNVMDSSHDAGR
ncbi:hypothetical protein Pmani_036288, partial [Petrolisthes manimaculis]